MKRVNLLELVNISVTSLTFESTHEAYMLLIRIYNKALLYGWKVLQLMQAVLETEAAPDQTRPLYFNQLTN